MSQERLKLAIGKLEHALSRAESNGDAIVQALKSHEFGGARHPDESYKALEKKHDLLKRQAAEALEAIESLIPMKGQN